MSTWDSSLRSEWHIKVDFVILNELLERKNPCCWGDIKRSETFIAFKTWFVQWVREILHFVQNDISRWILSFWTSFWRGRIPDTGVRVWVVKLLSHLKLDSSNEYVGFFTAFRMTFWIYSINSALCTVAVFLQFSICNSKVRVLISPEIK